MARNILFTALILGMAGIFYWQWQLIQVETASSGSNPKAVSQQITVNTNRNFIKVTQVFHHLKPNNEYKILVPKSISKWECVKKNGKPCVSKANNPRIIQPQSGELKIQFSIPFTKGSQTLFLTNWIMHLQNVNVQDYRIEVVDSNFRKGTWVASIPLRGSNKHELIDYYVFEGTGASPSLYWQAKQLNIAYQNRYFSAYSQKTKITDTLSQVKLPNGPVYVVYIYSNEHPATSVPGMVITHNQLSYDLVQKEWISNYFIRKFQRNSKNDWLVDVFSSLYFNKQGETKKGIYITKQLKSQFKDSDIQKLMKFVIKRDTVDTNKLDQQLSELKGLKTTFFSTNNRQYAALLFFDMHQVVINGATASNVEGILINDELFFPFIKTMIGLGYKVNENHDQNSVLLIKNERRFLFHYNQSSFLYNDQKYGMLENPFRKENGIIYINQRGFQTLFKVRISKSNEEIIVYPTLNGQ